MNKWTSSSIVVLVLVIVIAFFGLSVCNYGIITNKKHVSQKSKQPIETPVSPREGQQDPTFEKRSYQYRIRGYDVRPEGDIFGMVYCFDLGWKNAVFVQAVNSKALPPWMPLSIRNEYTFPLGVSNAEFENLKEKFPVGCEFRVTMNTPTEVENEELTVLRFLLGQETGTGPVNENDQ